MTNSVLVWFLGGRGGEFLYDVTSSIATSGEKGHTKRLSLALDYNSWLSGVHIGPAVLPLGGF